VNDLPGTVDLGSAAAERPIYGTSGRFTRTVVEFAGIKVLLVWMRKGEIALLVSRVFRMHDSWMCSRSAMITLIRQIATMYGSGQCSWKYSERSADCVEMLQCPWTTNLSTLHPRS
jgi:hypothetical protein